MKLRYSPTSPYTRKVVVVAIETGLDRRIERVATNVWDPATDIADQNPLGKVPTLVTDDQLVLFDSPVICEYLDSLHDGRKLFPEDGPERWMALRHQALADGIADAGVLRLMESRRPEDQQSPNWRARQTTIVNRGLDALEREVLSLGDAMTIGHIAIGCAIGWLEFRFPQDEWRGTRPRLSAWYDRFAASPSMQETVPREP